MPSESETRRAEPGPNCAATPLSGAQVRPLSAARISCIVCAYNEADRIRHILDAVHRHPHWMNFVRVTDATGAAQKAVALGGRVLVEPRPDRHGGQLAILADPTGAPFGVMEWAESDTKQEPPMP